MLSIVLSLVFASVSAQNSNSTTGISQECQALIERNTGLQACGTSFGSTVSSGSVPSISNSELDTFCSPACSEAINTLTQDILSPTCSGFANLFESAGLTAEDFTTLVKTVTEVSCLKDGPDYCPTSFETETLQTASPFQNQTLVCSNCFKLQYELFQTRLSTLSPQFQQQFSPVLAEADEARKTCPSNSALGMNVLSLVAMVMGMALF